ncbi:MAG: DivIVA domain-containing protein [Acidobacteriota bacterium]
MNVTPLDLRQQQFRTVMRGFDRDEVIAFLAEAADDYEKALQDTERLRQEVARLEGAIAEHKEHERDLRNTLMTAQRLSDDIRDNAHKQAAAIVKDGETRAGMVLDKAQSRLEDVQREIDGLRMKRRESEASVEAIISALRSTLDFIREQDARDREERVIMHRPRHSARDASWGPERRGDGEDDAPRLVMAAER